MPLNICVALLNSLFGVSLTTGGLCAILEKAANYFRVEYDKYLTLIRGSPVIHADETSYGFNNWWCWFIGTEEFKYYSLHQSRGGGVARKLLKDSIGVLVRDGYDVYTKLKMIQQACWFHLLKRVKEYAKPSEEVLSLQNILKTMFEELKIDVEAFSKLTSIQREELYTKYLLQLDTIIAYEYKSEDACEVQTYIKGQHEQFLTALLYPNVALTNNLAERAIRPMVIKRKISGGVKSKQAARTMSINMSIVQTLKAQQKPILPSLVELLKSSIPLGRDKHYLFLEDSSPSAE